MDVNKALIEVLENLSVEERFSIVYRPMIVVNIGLYLVEDICNLVASLRKDSTKKFVRSIRETIKQYKLLDKSQMGILNFTEFEKSCANYYKSLENCMLIYKLQYYPTGKAPLDSRNTHKEIISKCAIYRDLYDYVISMDLEASQKVSSILNRPVVFQTDTNRNLKKISVEIDNILYNLYNLYTQKLEHNYKAELSFKIFVNNIKSIKYSLI